MGRAGGGRGKGSALPGGLRGWCTCAVALFAAPAAATPLEDLLKLPLEDLLQVRVSVASRFDETPLQAASTVASITDTQWQTLGARKLHDAIGALPGTIVLPTWFGAEQIYIRGYADGNNSGGVATLWDGVEINPLEGSPQFYRENIQLGTLDRIEMIRGPGSALYGENAYHGVLSLHAFESDTDVTRVRGGAASSGYGQASVQHSQGLGAGRLNIAVAANGQTDQHRGYDYIDPVTRQPADSQRDLSYLGQTVVVKLASDAKRDVSYFGGVYYDKNQYDRFYSAGTTGSVAARDWGGVHSPFTMVQGGGRFVVNPRTDAELKAYYFHQERVFERTFSASTDFVGIGSESDYGLNLTFKQRELFGNTQWSAVLSARQGDMGDYYRVVTDASGANVPGLTGPLAFSNFKREIYSASLDAATALADGRWRLHYGGRYDSYSDFGGAFSPRLGVIYQAAPETAAKLLYGHAFRAPNAGEVMGFASFDGNPDLKPETIDTYELVLMRRTAALSGEFVLFRSRWDEAIITAPSTTPGRLQYINSGLSTAHGAEASLTYQAAPWTLTLNGSYVLSTNETLVRDYVAFPQWIVNAGIGYRFARTGVDVLFNTRVHLDASEGQIAPTLPAPAPLKDYWRSDLHVGKRWNPHWRFMADVRNLFARHNYLPSIQTAPSLGGLPDEPFSVMLSAQYEI